jgi:hypothetical protein
MTRKALASASKHPNLYRPVPPVDHGDAENAITSRPAKKAISHSLLNEVLSSQLIKFKNEFDCTDFKISYTVVIKDAQEGDVERERAINAGVGKVEDCDDRRH